MSEPVQSCSAEIANEALKRIAILCTQHMDRDCDHRMALDAARQIANDVLDVAQPAFRCPACASANVTRNPNGWFDCHYCNKMGSAEEFAAQPPAAPVEIGDDQIAYAHELAGERRARWSAANVDDPADLWDRYCAETPRKSRSPQGAMAFAFSALTSTEPQTTCCKGLAPSWECRCEIERKAAGHPPYQRGEPQTLPTREQIARAWLYGHCAARGFGFTDIDYEGCKGSKLWHMSFDMADRLSSTVTRPHQRGGE